MLNQQQLLAIGHLAKQHNIFVISDEVYKDFLYAGEPFFSLAQVPDFRSLVIRFFSFSKSYAMTGWRVGYLHTDESVAAEILKVHDALVTCAPVVSQYAAMGALEMGEADREGFKREYIVRRDLICQRLDRLKDVFSYVRPTSSYFVFPKILKSFEKQASFNSSWDFTLEMLGRARVVGVPGIAFGPSGEGHVRFSFGRSQEDISEAFNRLEKIF